MIARPVRLPHFEEFPDGYLAFDEGRCWSYVNRHAEHLLATSWGDLIGRSCDHAAPELLRRPELREALKAGVAADIEVRDAQNRWLEIRVRPGETGNCSVYLRDVSDRRRVGEHMRASEERFLRFMENLPGLAWMKDLDGRYLYANAAASQAFGHPLEHLLGRADDELFPPATAAAFREHDQQALTQSHGIQVVEALEQDDGVTHYSIVSKFPVLDMDRQVRGVGGMAIDVTDRVRAEEALRAADQRKNEFLAMLAHELRNPLAPLVTAAEILRVRASDDLVLRKQQEVIARQVRLMKRLLDDLLDVSRITRGMVTLTRERLDLHAVLLDAVEMSRPLILERGHALDLASDQTPLLMYGDHARLVQVFANLLNNAARYTQPGGKIRLSAIRRGDCAQIRVEDNGIGMTPQVMELAFELFAQGERSLARTDGGLGIGLTVVRQLVELHGGTVDVESAGIDQGSSFRVMLPLIAGDATTPLPEIQ